MIFKFTYSSLTGEQLLELMYKPDDYLDEQKNILSDEEVASLIKESSKVGNSQLPTIIEEGLVLKEMRFVEPKTIEYIYQFSDLEKDDLSQTAIRDSKNAVTYSMTSKKDVERLLKDNKVTFRFTYYDMNDELIFTLDVTPNQYQ